jgi:hypothetical protein
MSQSNYSTPKWKALRIDIGVAAIAAILASVNNPWRVGTFIASISIVALLAQKCRLSSRPPV